MDRDVAIRIDGMLIAIRGNLDGVARYMKDNLTETEYSTLIKSVGQSVSALVDLSSSVYSEFPDAVPKELIPPRKPEP